MAEGTGSTGGAGRSELSMKLLVDTKGERVVYAEAGKVVVDFLFSLLTLPLGTVVKLVADDGPMAGSSVGSLYGSVSDMDARYVACTSDAWNALLAPAVGHVVGDVLHLPATTTTKGSVGRFFRCDKGCDEDCCDYIAAARGTPCLACGWLMASEVEIVGEAPAEGSVDAAGFVHDLVTYTVTDDLSVAPMSTISGINKIISASGVTSIGALEERTVSLGYNEGLEILKASLRSKTVLTDVFLAKKKKREADKKAALILFPGSSSRATARSRRGDAVLGTTRRRSSRFAGGPAS